MTTLTVLIARRFSRGLRTGLARFTTVAAVVSVAIGCLALILAVSILKGYEEQIIATASSTMAHIEIQSLDPLAEIPPRLIAQLNDVPNVQSVETVITKEALVRSSSGEKGGIEGGIEGVMLLGAQPARLTALTGTAAGSSNGNLPPAWVGAEVARTLQCRPGDTLVIYTSKASQQVPIIMAVQVRGLLRTGMHSVDASMIAMQQADVQTVVSSAVGSSAASVLLTLNDPLRASAVAQHITGIVPPSMFVRTWQDRFQAVASWIEMQKRPIPIVLGLMSLVAMFTVASTLLVAVVEKTRSIAILITLGITPARVVRIIALRGLVLSATGAVVGASLAWTLAMIQHTWQPIRLDGAVYFVTALPVSLDPLPYVLVPALAILLAVIASVAPALLIRRIQPVRALRFS